MAVKISDLLPKSRSVEVSPGSELPLNALNLQHVALLMQTYEVELTTLFNEATPNFVRMVSLAPSMVANIIAMSADAIGQEEDVAKLPATVQVEAMTVIWEMSVPNPKNLMAKLEKLVADLRVAQVDLAASKLVSQNSSPAPSQS